MAYVDGIIAPKFSHVKKKFKM